MLLLQCEDLISVFGLCCCLTWISLGVGLLVRRNKLFVDVTSSSGKLGWTFFTFMTFHKLNDLLLKVSANSIIQMIVLSSSNAHNLSKDDYHVHHLIQPKHKKCYWGSWNLISFVGIGTKEHFDLMMMMLHENSEAYQSFTVNPDVNMNIWTTFHVKIFH